MDVYDPEGVRPALDLLAEMERQGFVFRMAEGKPVVAPASLLTNSQKDALRQHREALSWLVANMPSPEQQAYLDVLPPPSDEEYAGRCVAVVERWAGPIDHRLWCGGGADVASKRPAAGAVKDLPCLEALLKARTT